MVEEGSVEERPQRKERLARACTARTAARLFPLAPAIEQQQSRRAALSTRDSSDQCKEITDLSRPPPPSQLPRWTLRSMWELASLLNFLHVFRPLLNIGVEFTAEELETALITPNDTLADIHMPLLKAIPPITRIALGRSTWITVLCRKLKDWWHWVADGEVPIIASHGEEVEAYQALEPGTRVLILKALCDIRVEQEDIRNYIDDSIKHGIHPSAFRSERIGGDSHGTSYWYEDDPIIGHRLYREVRKIEYKKLKSKGIPSQPIITCQWETVAANFDEFQEVSEKLAMSKNRTEAALGKRLKIDILPEIEKIYKRKERQLKKQHRQAVLLDSFISADGLTSGRSLRDRKPVTYTFDDYDRSINEAIKITKKGQPTPEPVPRKEVVRKPETSTNGKVNGGSLHVPLQNASNDTLSPRSTDDEDTDVEQNFGPLDRSNRQRRRPQRYSEREFVEAVSDNEADFDSDEEIVGEAIYDEEYLRTRKHKRAASSSSSEGDEEYKWDEENADEEEEEEEDEEDVDSLSSSGELDIKSNRLSRNSDQTWSKRRRGMKLRSVGEIQKQQSGLRRSLRATRTRIDYRQYELSDSETESRKIDKSASIHSDDGSNNNRPPLEDDSMGSEEDENKNFNEPIILKPRESISETQENESIRSPTSQEAGNSRKRRFLDLNELAPGGGFDDGPSTVTRDQEEDKD
ncbi:hypothetical protein AMTR_s00133p00076510 [Amborella trichopoda]|uniref:DDT domain-containing protein n=2 Tax=Amborella trichopoda TaxID=13333 RepID=W1P9Y4_AMBTC|nr:hypothetical protein AMTR_s00133p00076510 [Amborella trichopoda]